MSDGGFLLFWGGMIGLPILLLMNRKRLWRLVSAWPSRVMELLSKPPLEALNILWTGFPFRSIGIASTALIIMLVAAQLSGISIAGQLYHRTHPDYSDAYNVRWSDPRVFQAIAEGDAYRVRDHLSVATQTQTTMPSFFGYARGYEIEHRLPTFAEYQRYWARARDHWYRATHIENANRNRAHLEALDSDNPEIVAAFVPYLQWDYFDHWAVRGPTRRHYALLMERAVEQEDYFSAYQAAIALVSLHDPRAAITLDNPDLANLFFLAGFFAEMSGRQDLQSGHAHSWLALFVDFIDNANADYARNPSPYEDAGRALLAEIVERNSN